MRLLERDSNGEFSLTKDLTDNLPAYAILSHTWGEDEQEVTFEDLTERSKHSKAGYQKIRFCGEQAAHDGLRYFWVDTCCIKKSDPIELQKSINSMFRWYKSAVKCYVYLSDVLTLDNMADFELAFQKAKWFTRGWTLQELLAPSSVEFFSADYKRLGDKSSLERLISQRTGIAIEALREYDPTKFSIDERVSWMAGREAKHEEDIVYSLLGIFGVFLPLIYGEGRENAFSRLQEEIERASKRRNFEDFSVVFSLSGIFETEHFVAREMELTEMHRILSGNIGRRTAVLYGLGGIGKTQLTVAYTKRYKHSYSAIFWFNIRDEASLKQSFAKIAKRILREHPSASRLGSINTKENLDEVVDAVKEWLSLPKNTRWLAIYDNYDNPKSPDAADSSALDIQEFLPESYHGSIIITTRSSQVTIGHQMQIRKLVDEKDGLEILLNTAKREKSINNPDAIKLAKKLDGLPLALATAGAYLKQVTTSFSDYLRLYEASWLKLQKTSPKLMSYEDRMLYSTWQLSLDRVKQQNELSVKLLQLWAYFDSQDVWFELLNHSNSYDPDWLRELTRDEMSFNEAIRVLCDHGLVERDQSSQELVESRGYSMHSCVHFWTIHVLNQEWSNDLAKMALNLIGSHIPGNHADKWWITQRRLLQHAARCSYIISNGMVTNNGMEWVFDALGNLYKDQGQLEDAEKMYVQALQGTEKALGPNHISTLDSAYALANLRQLQGNIEEAEKIHLQVLKGTEEALGPKHISTLNSVCALANLRISQGQLEEAENLYRKALQGYEEVLGPRDLSTLGIANNLGIIYRAQGRLAEAEKIYLYTLKGFQEVLGHKHPSMLDIVHNLGNLYVDQGKSDEAENMYIQALEGCKETLGPKHTSTFTSIQCLAKLRKNQGKLEEAEQLYLEALQGYDESLGWWHSSTIAVVGFLATIYQDRCYDIVNTSTSKEPYSHSAPIQNVDILSAIIQLVKLCIRYKSCQTNILFILCRTLRWINEDAHSVLAFSYQVSEILPRYNRFCDRCYCDLNENTSCFGCRSCKDIDLCGSCFPKYELGRLKDVMIDCQDHKYLEYPPLAENPPFGSQTMDQWLQELADYLNSKRISLKKEQSNNSI